MAEKAADGATDYWPFLMCKADDEVAAWDQLTGRPADLRSSEPRLSLAVAMSAVSRALQRNPTLPRERQRRP